MINKKATELDKKVIIIGKRSNLSNSIKKYLNDSIVLSTNQIKNLEEILIKNEISTVIYNTACKSTLINQKTDPTLFSYYSFGNLSEFIKICLKHETKVEKIIYTSTSAIYGNNNFSNEDSPCKINNLYASLKFSSELLLKRYISPSKIKLTITRIFNMYGGDDQFSIISKIGNAIKKNQSLQINNYGKSIRDFISINNVTEIYKLLILKDFDGIINVSSGRGYSIASVVKIAEEIFQKKLDIEHRKFDEIKVSIGSNEKLKKILNYKEFENISEYFRNFQS
mgnify:CR=1 FL=1